MRLSHSTAASKIEETRAVPGISAKLNTIAKIRGEYVIASKYDFWFLNADLSPKFHAAMDPWFSANVLDLVGITALDKDAYVLMGSNKSLLRVRQNPEADDVQAGPTSLPGAATLSCRRSWPSSNRYGTCEVLVHSFECYRWTLCLHGYRA